VEFGEPACGISNGIPWRIKRKGEAMLLLSR